jgi:hypothetical protein
MITTNQIKDLLDQGFSITSHALGRIGKVVKNVDHFVLIKTTKGSGVTRFDIGDPVEIEIDYSNKTAKIVHPDWAF